MKEGPSIAEFGWPYRITEFIFQWVSSKGRRLDRGAQNELRKRPFLRLVSHGFIWLLFVYVIFILACAAYVKFPVSPYTSWEVVGWAFLAIISLWSGAIGLYFGVTIVGLLLWLLLLISVSFTLSLGYLCWAVWGAQRRDSLWLPRYRLALLTGAIVVFALATFVDGSYRYWDRSFEVRAWARLVFVIASAWAALFCYLARDRVLDSETPRRILKWTVGLAIAIGLLVYWHADNERAGYFARTGVLEHPSDPEAWLDLARYYEGEGYRVADDPGDDERGPRDPTPYYEKALNSFNRAVELGATGFDVNSARADLADLLGRKQAAVAYAQEALRFASTSEPAPGENEVKLLREMIARNATASEFQREDELKRTVRNRRRENLPIIARWVFEVL